MKKRKKGRKFSRKIGPRKQLFRTLANNFFLHEKIKYYHRRKIRALLNNNF